LRRRKLARIVDLARHAIWRNGGPRGRIVLDNATVEEHEGIAALTGRPPRRGALRLNLADLDRWLNASFRCSLEATLTAYDGQPPRKRSNEQAQRAEEAGQRRSQWEDFLAELAAQDDGQSAARRWLLEGRHGNSWLIDRLVATADSSQDIKRQQIRLVVAALSKLPLAEPRRLSTFANDLAGDPHALDPGREAGHLLVLALLDCFGADAGLDLDAAGRLTAADRRALYESVRLSVDTVSSTVAVYGLRSLLGSESARDSCSQLQVLTLRQILLSPSARATHERVFAVENPSVFEDLLDTLETNDDCQARPTIVCTAGWPSLAAWRLLDLLVQGGARQIFYSGDFDLAGLRIAAAVRRRYPGQFVAWHLAPDDYRAAETNAGNPISAVEAAQLAGLGAEFPELVPIVQSNGRWAYQEALTPCLLADLFIAMSGQPTDATRATPERRPPDIDFSVGAC
jgi:uncharacterized protein (TIGR02679 family)